MVEIIDRMLCNTIGSLLWHYCSECACSNWG